MTIRAKIEISVSNENKSIAELIATKCNVTVEDVIAIAVNQFRAPIDISADTNKDINKMIKSELIAMKIMAIGIF